jgi:hypothetical protein
MTTPIPFTFKETKKINLETKHSIRIGSLVEVDLPGDYRNGIRLFVVAHVRDNDGSPLYDLCHNKRWEPLIDKTYSLFNRMALSTGWPKESLLVIKEPTE